MSEHLCCVITRPARNRLSRADSRKLEAIAHEERYSFVEIVEPTREYKAWFAGPNLGFPFDRNAEVRIAAAIRASGINYFAGVP